MDGPSLRLPADTTLHALSDPASADLVERLIASSPERTLYHERAYIDFARAQNGHADLVVLAASGNPLFGLPIHPSGARGVTTGYSGVLLPEGREPALRRSFERLAELVALNKPLQFHCLQSAQGESFGDRARLELIEWGLASAGLEGEPLYSRVLELEPGPADDHLVAGAGVAGADLVGELPSGYDPDVRNQLRQAGRKDLRVQIHVAGDEAASQALQERIHAIHTSSWQRTGLEPHPVSYLTALAGAVRGGGGTELAVIAQSPGGTDLAFVSCHLRGTRALYWAGGSVEEALPARANPLCLHAAIRACARAGVTAFELGRFSSRERSDKERAITAYKAQFGGSLVPVPNFSAGGRGR